MLNFSKLKTMIGTLLGASLDGSLSEDQMKLVSEKFGDKFAAAFNEQLTAKGASTTPIIEAATADLQSTINDLTLENKTLAESLKESHSLIEVLSSSSEPDTPKIVSNSTGAKSTPFSLVDKSMRHNAIAADMNETGMLPVLSAETIDVSELKKEFAKVVTPTDKKTILHSILNGFTSRKYFKMYNATLEWQAIHAVKKSVVQQFSPKWTPVKGFKFKPIKIRNFHHKINVEIQPAEIIESWLMYLYDESKSPDQMPLVKYIINNHILPQIGEDVELSMVWKGKYVEQSNPPSDGDAATPAHQTMNGIETTLCQALLLSGKEGDTGINFYNKSIDLATCTDDEILAHATGFKSWIKPIFKTKDMPLFCSLEYYERYKTAYKNKFATNSGNEKSDFGGDRLDFSRLWLTPIDGMYGSPIIFATPIENMIMLSNINAVPNVINDIQRANYTVKIFGEFWLGVGLAMGEAVFASVPANYNPQAVFADPDISSPEPAAESGL